MSDLQLLSTRYWFFRVSHNQFVQWPKWEEPTLDDVFGEPREELLRGAKEATTP